MTTTTVRRSSRRTDPSGILGVAITFGYVVSAAVVLDDTLLALTVAGVSLAATVMSLSASLAVIRGAAAPLIVALLLQALAEGIAAVPEVVSVVDDVLVVAALSLALGALRDKELAPRVRMGAALLLVVPLVGFWAADARGIDERAILLGTWLMLKPIAALVLGIAAASSARQAAWLKRVLGRIGVVVVAFAVLEFLAPSIAHVVTDPTDRLERSGLPVVRSFFPGPQEYGIFMVLIGALLWLAPDRPRDRSLGKIFLGLSLLSLRVKTFASFVVVLTTASLSRGGGTRAGRIIAVGLLLAAAGVVTYPVVSSILDRQADVYFSAGTEAPRQVLYATSWEIAREHLPAGTGVGSFGSHASIEFRSPVYAEYGLNDQYGFGLVGPLYALDTSWPVVLSETGFLGLGMVLLGGRLLFGRRLGPWQCGPALRWGALLVVMLDVLASAHLYDPLVLAILGWTWSRAPAVDRPRT